VTVHAADWQRDVSLVSGVVRQPLFVIQVLVRRSLKTSRKENAVSLTADLGVVDDRRCRIGNELEAVPGAHGCDSRNGNSHVRDLEEVPGEMVYCVMDADEALYDAAPLDVNRIDPPTHESKWPVRADTVRNGEGVEHCADILGVELSTACRQIYLTAAFRHWSRPERQALRGAGIPGVIATRARRAQRVKSYERERALMFEPVNRYKRALKESPVGVERVRRAVTGVQVCAGAAKIQIGIGNKPFEVRDGGRVKACEGEVWEAGWGTAVGRSGEEKVPGASNVRNGPREGLALVIRPFVLRKC